MGRVVRVLLTRWHSMFVTGHREISIQNNLGIRYSQSRDMAFILRAILPMAAELASSAKPEWQSPESAMSRVVTKYALALTLRDQGLDCLTDDFRPLMDNSEEAQAFAAFGASLSLCLLVYLLMMPHLVGAIGEVHPETAEVAVSGITRTMLIRGDRGFWPFSWFRERRREKYIRKLVAQGTLPEAAWIGRFMGGLTSNLIGKAVEEFTKHGAIQVTEPEKETQDESAKP